MSLIGLCSTHAIGAGLERIAFRNQPVHMQQSNGVLEICSRLGSDHHAFSDIPLIVVPVIRRLSRLTGIYTAAEKFADWYNNNDLRWISNLSVVIKNTLLVYISRLYF